MHFGRNVVCVSWCMLSFLPMQLYYFGLCSKNFSSGFFGGEGFVLQSLTGEGDVFVKAGGTLIRRDLRPGEQLRISSGCLVAFSNGVDYGA